MPQPVVWANAVRLPVKLPAAAPDARPGSWRKRLIRAAIRSPGKRGATGGMTSTAEREVAPCTA
ncbi:hypothetical protein KVR801_340052 [Klebsiella variicola]|nr:hypothetical protein KVR801_340052 [Klebsiella variicola]